MTGGKRYLGMASVGNYQLGRRYDISNLSIKEKEDMFMHCVLTCEDAYTPKEVKRKSTTDRTKRTAQRKKSTAVI